MIRFLAIMLAAVLTAGFAFATSDSEPPAGPVTLGVFADPDGSSTRLEATIGEPFDIHLVLRTIDLAQGVRGWECAVRSTPNLRFVEWSYAGHALNFCEPPEFAVGIEAPLPAAGAITLARARCVLTDDRPARVWIEGASRSSVVPPAPAYVAGDPEPAGAVHACDGGGASLALEINAATTTETTVLGNSPNPFNPQTTIRFSLPSKQPVRLVVFAIDGRRVATLVDGTLAAGAHAVQWRGCDDSGKPLASGTYVYRLETDGGAVQTGRMVLVK